MKRRIKPLIRLRWLRERQRNHAAARRGATERSLATALDELDEAQMVYRRTSDELVSRVHGIDRVSEIERLRDNLDGSRRAILAAQHVAAQARLHLEARATEQQKAERAFRTSDKLLANATKAAESDRDRAEQAENDDQTARRKRSA